MKLDLSYINTVDIYPSEKIITKEQKEFYNQKLVIKGDKELVTIILRSSKPLINTNFVPEKEKSESISKTVSIKKR